MHIDTQTACKYTTIANHMSKVINPKHVNRAGDEIGAATRLHFEHIYNKIEFLSRKRGSKT